MSRKTDDTEELKQRFLETKQRLSEHLRALGRELGEEFNETVDKASTRIELGAERLTSTVSQTVDETVARVDETVARLKDRVDVRAAVDARPWRTIGISVVTGLGMGLLFTRRRPRPLALPAAPELKAEPVEESFPGLFGAVIVPTIAQLARAGAGQFLEQLLETSVRKAHASLEAHSPRYARAADKVRHYAGAREDLH